MTVSPSLVFYSKMFCSLSLESHLLCCDDAYSAMLLSSLDCFLADASSLFVSQESIIVNFLYLFLSSATVIVVNCTQNGSYFF